jgi:hypothetical protein
MSFAPLAAPPVGDLDSIVDTLALDSGHWVVVELGGVVLAHGVGRAPCPAPVSAAILAKSTGPLRRAVRWTRGTGRLRGDVEGVDVTAVEMGGAVTAWLVGDAGDADEALLALVAAAVHSEPAITDSLVAELLHPRAVRHGHAPGARLVVIRADLPLAALCTYVRRVAAGRGARIHAENDNVVVVLAPDDDTSELVEELRTWVPGAVAGVADVPPRARDWVAGYELARKCLRIAAALGLPLGQVQIPRVAAEVLLEEARESVSDVLDQLSYDPLALLRQHDERSGSELVANLAAWCAAAFDVTVAASALHVHQNTLRYRLHRAEQICGMDLRQPRQRLALQLLLGE